MKDPDKFKSYKEIDQLIQELSELSNIPVNVGWSADSTNPFQTLDLVQAIQRTRVPGSPVPIQIGASDYLKFTMDFPLIEKYLDAQQQGNLSISFHAPFWINLHRSGSEFIVSYSMRWARAFGQYLKSLGTNKVYDLVVHTNYPAGPADYLSENVPAFLDKLGDHCRVLFENQAGSAKHSRDSYALEAFLPILANRSYNTGFCFDTEHAHADAYVPSAGVDFRTYMYHLNSAPASIASGSHIDLHSYSRIRDCQHPALLDKISKSIETGLPCILERWPLEVVVDDLRYLSTKEMLK